MATKFKVRNRVRLASFTIALLLFALLFLGHLFSSTPKRVPLQAANKIVTRSLSLAKGAPLSLSLQPTPTITEGNQTPTPSVATPSAASRSATATPVISLAQVPINTSVSGRTSEQTKPKSSVVKSTVPSRIQILHTVKPPVVPVSTPSATPTDPAVMPCPEGYPKIDANTGLPSVCYILDISPKYLPQIPDWKGFIAPTFVFDKILSCSKSDKQLPNPFGAAGVSWVWTITPQFDVVNGNYLGGYGDPARPMTSLYKLTDTGHYTYTINAYVSSVATDVDHADVSIRFDPFNWFIGVNWAPGYEDSRTITYHVSSPISAKDCA